MDLHDYLLRHLDSAEETAVDSEDPGVVYIALSEY
jgi:hypothetical protein